MHTTLATIQWVTSGYLLALVLALPLNAWLVHRVGAKTLYLWCFAAFTAASVLCGLAGSARLLIGLRLLQGISGGLLAPMAQMMIATAAGRHMARVVGYMALPVLLAPVLGPIVAGVILQIASWRWLFWVNLPVGVAALGAAVVFLPPDARSATSRRLDWSGLALLSPGLAAFLYGADQLARTTGRLLCAVGLMMVSAFIWTARRKGEDALVDLSLFKGKVFCSAAIIQFLSNGVQYAGQMLIPAFLIQACGRTPGQMGWLLAPLGLGMMFTYASMGWLTDRFGIRRVSAGGALATLLATAPFLYLALHGLNLFILVPALFLRGMGLSAVGLPSMTAAYLSVGRSRVPMATTSLNIVQRLGGPTLTTLCASLLAWRLGSHAAGAALSSAYTWAFVLLCVLHTGIWLTATRLPWRPEDLTQLA